VCAFVCLCVVSVFVCLYVWCMYLCVMWQEEKGKTEDEMAGWHN